MPRPTAAPPMPPSRPPGTAAGFVLEEKSEVNANPADTKDHPDGVWMLPPNNRHDDADKAKFAAIGESDRMTLRFVKPQPAAE